MIASLARRWFLLLLVLCVSLALAVPAPVVALTAGLEPRVAITGALFLIAFTMPSRSLLGELAQPWAALWAVIISYSFVPAAGLLLGELSPLPDLRIGLLVASCVPCTLSTAVLWTRFAGGNEATALLATLGGTFLSWGATTAWLAAITGAAIDLAASDMMLDLVYVLILPVLFGQALRAWPRLAHLATRRRTLLGVISQVLVLVVVFKTAGAVGLQIRAGAAELSGGTLFLCTALGVILHLAALYFGLVSSQVLSIDRPRRLAIAFSCSQKTLPVSLMLFEKYYQTRYPLAVIPLLFYHMGQLLADTVIAERMKRRKERTACV